MGMKDKMRTWTLLHAHGLAEEVVLIAADAGVGELEALASVLVEVPACQLGCSSSR